MPDNEASGTIQPRREISTQEASRISGLSLNHLAYLLRQGKLEGRRFGDRTWMIYEDSLRAYLATPHKPGRPVKKHKNNVKKLREKFVHQISQVTPAEQIKYLASEARIVVGYGYGEQLQTNLSSTDLYSLASPNALWLMQKAEIERFAVDDCIILTNSRDFAGWDADEIRTIVLSSPMPVPADLEEIRQIKIPTIEKHYFNSSHYRLASFTPSFTDFGRLDIILAPLRFYDYCSLIPFLDEPLLTDLDGTKISVRQKYTNTALTYDSNDRGTAIIPTPVSLQCVVVTKDQQVILVERSSSVAYYPYHWSASFEENMAAPGVDWRGRPIKSDDANFVTGAIRGLETEFAIPQSAIESIKILSLNVEYLTLSVDVIILIKTNLDSEAIRQRWIIEAQDRDEASRFASISTDLHEVVDKLFSKTLWHPTSRMRLIQFLFHTYGVKEVAKAI
ncbi:MAG: helix-turn-helix domain-containing protein, partial [Ktedonobacteraceae bacterium]